jgi:hypothetical protein
MFKSLGFTKLNCFLVKRVGYEIHEESEEGLRGIEQA